MKIMVNRFFCLVLLGALLSFGFSSIKAGALENQNSFDSKSKRKANVTEKAKSKSEQTGTVEAKRLRSIDLSKKENISTKAELKTSKKNEVCSNSINRRGPGWECMKNCLARDANPEVIIQCAEKCSNSEYAACALCIGVGVYVVASCAVECTVTGIGMEESQY